MKVLIALIAAAGLSGCVAYGGAPYGSAGVYYEQLVAVLRLRRTTETPCPTSSSSGRCMSTATPATRATQVGLARPRPRRRAQSL